MPIYAGKWLLPEPYQAGLVIVCAVPCTLASAAIWTRMGGGNEAIALMMTMITNSLVFVGTAGWLLLLTGTSVQLDPMTLIGALVVYVVVPVLLAQGLRATGYIGAFADRHKTTLSVICRLFILMIIVKAAVEASTKLTQQANNGGVGGGWDVFELVQVAAVCIAVHLVVLVTGFLLAQRAFSREDAVAVAISGSQKTLPVGMLVAVQYFPADPLAIVPVLFFHVCQLIVDTYICEIWFHPGEIPNPEEIETAAAD